MYWGAFAAALLWMAGYLERQAARAFDTLRPSIDLAPEDAARSAGGWSSFPLALPRS